MGDVQIDEVDKEHGVDFVDELFDGIEIVTSDGDINVASGMSFMPSLRTEQPCLRLMIAANRRHSSDVSSTVVRTDAGRMAISQYSYKLAPRERAGPKPGSQAFWCAQ